MNSLIRHLLVALIVIVCINLADKKQQTNASILDDIKAKTNDVVKAVTSVCLVHDNCNKNFFDLNNYCCFSKGVQCCDYISFVFQNDKVWENFQETFKYPRAINIILFVVAVLVLSLLISAILSLISYFFCGCSSCCCGSRKYTIVSRG